MSGVLIGINRGCHQNDSLATASSVVILSDMSTIESGPFACIPGSHKASFECPYDVMDARNNPMAVPVFASPGDVR